MTKPPPNPITGSDEMDALMRINTEMMSELWILRDRVTVLENPKANLQKNWTKKETALSVVLPGRRGKWNSRSSPWYKTGSGKGTHS